MKQHLLNTTSHRALLYNLYFDEKVIEHLIRTAAIQAVKGWKLDQSK